MSEEQIIYGVCKYCGQARAVERLEVLSAAKNFDLSDEEAADYVASETCSCEQAKAQATHKMKLQAAGAWAEKFLRIAPKSYKRYYVQSKQLVNIISDVSQSSRASIFTRSTPTHITTYA